jgi:hypothetical protein
MHQCVPQVAAVRICHGRDVEHIGFIRVVSPVATAAGAAASTAGAACIFHGRNVEHVDL